MGEFMPYDRWFCSVCSEHYHRRSDAEGCEERHAKQQQDCNHMGHATYLVDDHHVTMKCRRCEMIVVFSIGEVDRVMVVGMLERIRINDQKADSSGTTTSDGTGGGPGPS